MPSREREPRVAASRRVALWADAAVAPVLSSFSEGALAAAARAAPRLPRALLLDAVPADWAARAQALGCVAIDVSHRHLDAELIAQAHARGLKVLSYTVNDPQRARALLDWGLDGLITDAIDLIAPE
jgi:glycerophosphoryl diester phosphodiesterase